MTKRRKSDPFTKMGKTLGLSMNVMKGKQAESMFAMSHSMTGNVKRRSDRKGGYDYEYTPVNYLTGKKGRTQKIEVKSSSTAPVSKLQRKYIKKQGVKVYRY